jgi:thioredoxin-dependent peroxiredoxin
MMTTRWWLIGIAVMVLAGCAETREPVDLTASNEFDHNVLQTQGTELVLIHVSWEPASLEVQKLAEELVAESEGSADVMHLIRIDADAAPELVEELGIEQYPALLVYREGVEQARWEGPVSEATVREELGLVGDERTTTSEVETLIMNERTGVITFGGNALTLVGQTPAVGDVAPDATLLDNDLELVSIASRRGKILILSVVPSLDTGVCDTQTRRFNQAASLLDDDVRVLTISMDLPFAQARWCGAAGIDRVETLSDHRDAQFGENYGLLIKELRLLARAVLVIDRDGTVQYVQIVPEMTDEPDYDAALAAAEALAQ